LAVFVRDFATPQPQDRAISKSEGEASRLALQRRDPLLDQIPKEDGPDVLFLACLMQMQPALNVSVLKGTLDGDPSPIGEANLSGPGIKTDLADLKPY
jgi:hypothetical protein